MDTRSKRKEPKYSENVRREVSRYFRNKKKAYLRDKIEELKTKIKIQKLGTCIGASITLRRGTSLEVK